MSRIADRLVLSKVREAIGFDKCEVCVSSAAPISRSTLDFLVSLNLPIVEILGMTETTGQSCEHIFYLAYSLLQGVLQRIFNYARTLLRCNEI